MGLVPKEKLEFHGSASLFTNSQFHGLLTLPSPQHLAHLPLDLVPSRQEFLFLACMFAFSQYAGSSTSFILEELCSLLGETNFPLPSPFPPTPFPYCPGTGLAIGNGAGQAVPLKGNTLLICPHLKQPKIGQNLEQENAHLSSTGVERSPAAR